MRETSGKRKLEYERPELFDIMREGAGGKNGECENGTGAGLWCEDGLSAGSACYAGDDFATMMPQL